MRVLVTGATGFVGEHLIRFLASRKAQIYGTYLSKPDRRFSDVNLLCCDIKDPHQVCAVVHESRPDRIFHLAAISKPSESMQHFKEVYDTNFWGTYNLLEGVRQFAPKARVLIVGTGQCYGNVRNTRKPIAESQPFAPPNPYALSKASADLLAWQYHSRFGLHVVRARPFNHTGPGQPRGFVCSDYAYQAAEIELNRREAVISIRDANVERDFSDVRDVVRAYNLLLQKGMPGEAYNVASNRTISIRRIVTLLVSLCPTPIRILEQRQGLHAGDIQCLTASNLKLRRATAWMPTYDMRRTIHDLLRHWVAMLKLTV